LEVGGMGFGFPVGSSVQTASIPPGLRQWGCRGPLPTPNLGPLSLRVTPTIGERLELTAACTAGSSSDDFLQPVRHTAVRL
jgi:hypothetical protein